MRSSMMQRGNAQPGMKTMLDSLDPAITAYEREKNARQSQAELLAKVQQAALQGAQATKNMPAVKGRASYRIDQGVGYIDPGAVTMSIQIQALCEYLTTLQ